jgi:hypothetical protein
VKTKDNLADLASKYLGYTCNHGNLSVFGRRVGWDGHAWNGSFIDVIFLDNGLQLPVSHTHTVAALGHYLAWGHTVKTPRRGDLVFYSFGVDPMGAPHIGVVSDVAHWKQHRRFSAIEANVATPNLRAPQDPNGVYERIRHKYDVLVFVRPDPIPLSTLNNVESEQRSDLKSKLPLVRVGEIRTCVTPAAAARSPKIARSVELIQVELSRADVAGLEQADRGVFDSKTRSALAKFQRERMGLVNATGDPTLSTLKYLGSYDTPGIPSSFDSAE